LHHDSFICRFKASQTFAVLSVSLSPFLSQILSLYLSLCCLCISLCSIVVSLFIILSLSNSVSLFLFHFPSVSYFLYFSLFSLISLSLLPPPLVLRLSFSLPNFSSPTYSQSALSDSRNLPSPSPSFVSSLCLILSISHPFSLCLSHSLSPPPAHLVLHGSLSLFIFYLSLPLTHSHLQSTSPPLPPVLHTCRQQPWRCNWQLKKLFRRHTCKFL